MPTKVKGTTGVDKVEAGAVITNPAFSGDATVSGSLTVGGVNVFSGPYRNLIINGDMRIAQRGTNASGITGSAYSTVDRYLFGISGQGTWTNTQSTDVPTGQGFSNSYKLECTTADASPAATDVINIQHRIEAQNCQYLNYGTSSAKTTTLSFWVKSNKTGTYNLNLRKDDDNRRIVKQYTISSANTWEKKIITIEGDTSGAINNDNGVGIQLTFWLGAGSDYTTGSVPTGWGVAATTEYAPSQVNLADSTSNYINITGVQLEVGEGASDFEFLPYDVQLQRCERYYQKSYNISSPPGNIDTSGQEVFQIDDGALQRDGIRYRTRMRLSGSINIYNPNTGTNGQIRTNSGASYSCNLYAGGETGLFISYTPATGEFLSFHWTADSEL